MNPASTGNCYPIFSYLHSECKDSRANRVDTRGGSAQEEARRSSLGPPSGDSGRRVLANRARRSRPSVGRCLRGGFRVEGWTATEHAAPFSRRCVSLGNGGGRRIHPTPSGRSVAAVGGDAQRRSETGGRSAGSRLVARAVGRGSRGVDSPTLGRPFAGRKERWILTGWLVGLLGVGGWVGSKLSWWEG